MKSHVYIAVRVSVVINSIFNSSTEQITFYPLLQKYGEGWKQEEVFQGTCLWT
jgi:hypothetical protein